MRKTKILLGAVSLTAISPVMPLALSSCGCSQLTYTVTFDTDGGTDVPNQQVLAGNTAANPSVSKSGYRLVGWFNGDKQWDFNTPVTENITLKAHWDTKPITLVLYAGEGEFTSGQSVLTLTDITPGTKLKDVGKYIQPTKTNETFAYWVDVENYKYTGESEITENLLLGARFKETALGEKYSECNWAQVIEQSSTAVKFANFFLKDEEGFTTFTDDQENEAIEYINGKIRDVAEGISTTLADKKISLSSLGSTVEVNVRLVGVGFDHGTESNKTLFTFEFANTISKSQYSYHANNTWCKMVEGQEQDSCYLRDYCNSYLINALPANIVDAIQPVTKTTHEPKPSVSSVETLVETTEKLFPLSFTEMGIARGTKATTYSLGMDVKAVKTYPYYRYATDVSLAGTNHSSKTHLEESAQTTYWMRDPVNVFNGSAIYHRVYCIRGSDNMSIWDYTDQRFSIAPAFCI